MGTLRLVPSLPRVMPAAESGSTAAAMAEVDRVLSNPVLKAHLERKTARLGKTIAWPYVAAQYANLATRIANLRIAGIPS